MLLYLDLDVPVLDVSNSSPVEGRDNVTFTCNAVTTDTIITYTWYHDKGVIPKESGKTYNLTRGNRTNSGDYACEVTTANLKKNSTKEAVTFLCKYPKYQLLSPWRTCGLCKMTFDNKFCCSVSQM